jgi:hypothetical protein
MINITNKTEHNFLLYNYLCQYGSVYELKLKINSPKEFIKWTEENFKYVQYNPRKLNNRLGLSITSLDGGISGIPDLDSLHEYNKENNTTYSEESFTALTSVYEYPSIKNAFSLFKDDTCRTHIIKLNPGGFFPPHRDLVGNFDTFRLVVPLDNVNPPFCNFVVDGVTQNFTEGKFYFVDTAKLHYLFNSSFLPSYWIVANIKTSINSVTTVLNHVTF